MEWLTTFFIILAVVLLVGGFFAALGVRGPGRNLLWFFILLFLATWAIGAWAEPVGPRAWGVPWVGYFIVALFIGLLIAAVTHDARAKEASGVPGSRTPLAEDALANRDADEDREGSDEAAAVATVLNLFFWAFVVVALFLLAVRVFVDPAG